MSLAHFDATTGRELRVNEPLRSDLKPGETVTWTPDRFCTACSQARGTRLCPICGAVTEPRAALSPVDQVPLSFERPMGAVPPDPGARELEQLDELEPLDVDGAGALEPLELLPRIDAELGPGNDEDEDEDDALEPPHPSVRGARTVMEPPGDRVRGRQTQDVDVPTRRKRIVDVEPRPARRENPYPVRDKRRTVPTFNPEQGAARMSERNQTAARRIPQRAVEVDEGGREIHRSGNARRARSLEDVYDELWDGGKVDVNKWCEFASARATTGAEPEDAANFADELYMQLILRQQKK